MEKKVVDVLFEMQYKIDKTEVKTPSYIAVVTKQIESEIKELDSQIKSAVHTLVLTNNSPYALEEYNNLVKQKEEKEKMLIDQQRKELMAQKVIFARNALRNLQNTWEFMTPEERQTVCRELIEKVIIYKNRKIEIRLHLQDYLLKQEKNK